MQKTRIPEKKKVFKTIHNDDYRLIQYEYFGEGDEKNVAVFKHADFSSIQSDDLMIVSYFSDLETKFKNLTEKKLTRLIEEYDEEYEESKITHVEQYDEDERRLTKKDWQGMLENLDMPREKHESRPVVCNDGLLCFNAATGCRVVDVNPKRGDELYKAVEKKKKFKKQYWRYATRDEIEAQINNMSE